MGTDGINLWASGITAAVVIWGIWLGAEAGVGHALGDLIGAVCGAVLGLAALNPLVHRVMPYILDNLYYTRALVFWGFFFLAFGLIWQIKESAMKTKIALPAPVDAIGGGIIGAMIGLVVASSIVLTVFMPPRAESTPEWAVWEGSAILLHTDRAVPGLYRFFSVHNTFCLTGDYDVDDFVKLWCDPMHLTELRRREAREAERLGH